MAGSRKKWIARSFSVLLLPFLFSCNHYFYYPDRNLYFPYQKTGYAAREVHFSAQDGNKLYGWFFPSQSQPVQGTVIQFHGNAENLSSHYLSLVWLTQVGYQLFTFDYRGYGRSEGEADPDGVFLDSLAALAKAREFHAKLPNSENATLILYGQSLGGAIGMRAIAELPKNTSPQLIVLDSTFASYSDIAHKKLKEHWLTWLFSPLAWLLVSDKYASTESLRANKIPLMVIHDKEDPAVPFSCGQEIFNLATAKKDFWVLNEGKHIGVFSQNHQNHRKLFLQKVQRLLDVSSAN